MSNAFRTLFVALIMIGGVLALLWYSRDHLGFGTPSEKGTAVPVRPWSDVSGSPASAGESAYQRAELLGTITDKRLTEISGITASRRADNVWWVHNDSGDLPRIFAVNSKGDVIGEVRVVGAINEDWEDIASGPAADLSPALYIADIGDNFLKRDFVVIYRVQEPDLSREGGSSETAAAEPFQFRYPDRRHNAEALIVDPASGRMYVITKTDSGGCQVFRSPLPLKLGEPMTFEVVKGAGDAVIAPWRKVTGATTAPDGSRVVIRTYFSAFELRRPTSKEFESLFSAAIEPIILPLEQQGEAIGYSRDGRSLVTTSEKIPAPISLLRRK